MKVLVNTVMILGGLGGAVVGFFGSVTVDSAFGLNGQDISLALGLFCAVVFLRGIYQAAFGDS